MLKLLLQAIDNARKYPGLSMILVIYTTVMIWAYFSLSTAIEAKADKDTVYQEMKAANHKLDNAIGELKGMAKYFTGKSTFNGDDASHYPPARYIIDNDSITIPNNGYDSCICAPISDTSLIRYPWFCYKTDTSGVMIIEEFR